ncbi:hypothetical protein AVEN_26337-1 [Araneus ventricosus]|uniref:Uncharacterized protein n=1 Tax=Araneus ventricosus TaxID=182803 RepID=A0A4Y2AM18_ARAVE|nr:hypothetical protein AVEN_26337-1 [Araneus ventricosus]
MTQKALPVLSSIFEPSVKILRPGTERNCFFRDILSSSWKIAGWNLVDGIWWMEFGGCCAVLVVIGVEVDIVVIRCFAQSGCSDVDRFLFCFDVERLDRKRPAVEKHLISVSNLSGTMFALAASTGLLQGEPVTESKDPWENE